MSEVIITPTIEDNKHSRPMYGGIKNRAFSIAALAATVTDIFSHLRWHLDFWNREHCSDGDQLTLYFLLKASLILGTDNCARLDYYAAGIGNSLPVFRDNLSVSSSVVSSLSRWPIGCSETSVRDYHYSLRTSPEERNSHIFRDGSLKSHIISGSFFHVPTIIPSTFNSNKDYLLTPWCRVLLEKLTGLQLVKKFPAFHGTRRLITALTSVRHLSLSWTSQIQSTYPHPTSWRSILILSTHLRWVSPVVSFPPVSPAIPYTPPSPHPYAPHAQPISFFSILSSTHYWMRSTNHLVPRYAISSILPLPRPS